MATEERPTKKLHTQQGRDAYDLRYYRELTQQEEAEWRKEIGERHQYLIDIAYRAVSETQPPEGYAINAVELVDKVTRGRVTVRTFDGDIEGDSTILEVRIREAFESSVADDAKVYIACHKNSSGEVVRTTLKVIDGGLNP